MTPHQNAALATLRQLHAACAEAPAGAVAGATAISLPAALSQVRRAWPGKDAALSFEAADRAGNLRAGRVTAAGEVRLAPFGQDSKLPSLQVRPGQVLVVHRLGKRAVTVGDVVTKHLRAGKASGAGAASSLLAAPCRQAGINTAAVVDVGPNHLSFTKLPGRTLHQLGADAKAGWLELAQRWGKLVCLPPPPSLPVHGPTQEASVLRTWLAYAQRHSSLPHLDALERAVEQTCAQLLHADTSPSSWVITHRDLHDKQVLWDGTTLSLLDLDTAAMAEGALDLGNLSAHIDLRLLQGLYPPQMASILSDLVAQMAARQGVSAPRLATYQRAARLRLAFVYSFRPTSAAWLEQWVAQTL